MFYSFFDEFSSPLLTRTDVIEKLRSSTDYTEKSCVSRTGHARRIIQAGKANSALQLIISSPRATQELREDAHKLLQKLNV